MSMPKVCVLMSTYNGEKYIEKQIESILHQKQVEVSLLIRDDGSCDRTILICQEYEKKYANVSVYQGNNKGVGKSFLDLLKNAPLTDYYAFADQDDYWLEDKLIRAISIIQETEKKDLSSILGSGKTVFTSELLQIKSGTSNVEYPILYGSNLMKVDEDLHLLGLRYKGNPSCSLLSSISRNIIYGCTMVMNKAMREECVKVDLPSDKILKCKNHDGWVLYIAHIIGVFIYDSESFIYYREHPNQVVGAKDKVGLDLLSDFISRLIHAKNKGVRSTLAKELLDKLSDKMGEDIKKHLEILRSANTIRGVKKLVQDKELLISFRESKEKILLRSIIKWI